MFRTLIERGRQRHRTTAYPRVEPTLPERFRGRPLLDSTGCPSGCKVCIDTCPTGAITLTDGRLTADLGRCLFCIDCERACPEGHITASDDHRMAARRRDDLSVDEGGGVELATRLGHALLRVLGRSLRLRQVSAGGCNACEADANVLTTVVFDMGRFGIDFVASPRHADGLLVTGPVTRNMQLALRKTYEAVPDPKIVVAVGACAISGGLYAGNPEVLDGAASTVPVDLYVPGCPPHPYTLLDGLLRLVGRLDGDSTPAER